EIARDVPGAVVVGDPELRRLAGRAAGDDGELDQAAEAARRVARADAADEAEHGVEYLRQPVALPRPAPAEPRGGAAERGRADVGGPEGGGGRLGRQVERRAVVPAAHRLAVGQRGGGGLPT